MAQDEMVTLGPEGTFASRAARRFSEDITPVSSIRRVVEEVAIGNATYGTIPIEHNVEGDLTESLDALVEFRNDIQIIREFRMSTRLSLLASDDLENVETVASYPTALSRCREALSNLGFKERLTATTIEAVELARESTGTIAALAHPQEATGTLRELRGDLLRETYQSRFFVIETLPSKVSRRTEGQKSTILIYPDADYPGLLVELLEPFGSVDINLARIRSRPNFFREQPPLDREQSQDYLFHMDVKAGLHEERMETALEAINTGGEGWITPLGSYPVEEIR